MVLVSTQGVLIQMQQILFQMHQIIQMMVLVNLLGVQVTQQQQIIFVPHFQVYVQQEVLLL